MQRLSKSLEASANRPRVLVLFLQSATTEELFRHLKKSFKKNANFQIVLADGIRHWPVLQKIPFREKCKFVRYTASQKVALARQYFLQAAGTQESYIRFRYQKNVVQRIRDGTKRAADL